MTECIQNYDGVNAVHNFAVPVTESWTSSWELSSSECLNSNTSVEIFDIMREAQLGAASASILNHTCENLIWFNDLLNIVLNARQTVGYTK